MYEKDLLEIQDPDDDVYDARWDDFDTPLSLNQGFVCLPHSCDKWVIGGPEQIKMLIGDLQKALIELEKEN